MMQSILIVEDEEVTSLDLELFCQVIGYDVVDTVATYDTAVQSIERYHPSLLLCDIALEGRRSGLEVAQYAHDHYEIPVVFLTAYYNDTILSQAKKLDVYGYILKPYKEQELEATLKLAFHHMTQKTTWKQRYVELESYLFDMKTLRLFNQESEIILGEKSRKLLFFFLLYPNEPLTYDTIIDFVYDGEDVPLDTLRQLIRRLRKLFRADPIQSIRNIGYAFTLEREGGLEIT